MNVRAIVGLAGLALLVAVSTAHAQQKPEDLLQSARYAEEVRGDLTAAVRVYQSIVRDFPEHRSVAATALVRLGRAYETLGDAEAQQAAYQRVLSDYSDQAQAAAQARAQLATLQSDNRVARRLGIVTRQVWPDAAGGRPGRPDVGSISPDGRYLAFTDWIAGFGGDPMLRGHADLAVFDTETGRSRLLTDRPPQTVSSTYVESMAWSADGERLAYTAWNEGFEHQELHVLRSDGSDDHILVANDQMPNVRPMAWSQDGDFIVSLFQGWDEIRRIGLVSTEDGRVQILKTLGTHDPWPLSLSPDGKYVVYDYPQADGETEHDVFILATDGSSEERLVSHSADDERPFWTPDGGRVVFLSDRSGRRGLYSLEVRDGRPAGDPELVRPDVGPMVTLGFSRTGALYYRLQVNVSDVHVAELDLNGAATLSESTLLTERFEGTNGYPSWSPDGRRIAYFSHRGQGLGLHVVVKTLDTGEENNFAIPFALPRQGAHSPEWSADGRHLLIEGIGIGVVDDPRRVSYRLDLETGEVAREPFLRDYVGRTDGGSASFATAAQSEALRAAGVRMLPAPKNEMRAFRDGDEPLRPGEKLMWVNNGGVGRVSPGGDVENIGPTGHVHTWALSPDGTQLAWAIAQDTILQSNRLLIMPVTGGAIRELTRLPRPPELGDQPPEIVTVKWTPDGKSLLYDVRWPAEPAREPELWQVGVEGGTPERLDVSVELNRLRLHPDGKRVAFWTQEARTEIWLMEGFSWQDSGR